MNNNSNNKKQYTSLDFTVREYNKEKVIEILQKAVAMHTNTLQYLIDCRNSGIYYSRYVSQLYNDLNDYTQAMKYVRANLK